MSRVGKAPIAVAKGVKVEIKDGVVKVEGPKGKLQHSIPAGVKVTQEGEELKVTRDTDKFAGLQGVTRTLVSNMVHGVSTGFVRELDIVGVGYRAAVKGSTLNLTLGFSHPVEYKLPEGITAKVEQNTHLVLSGADKERLGMVAADIRGFRPPEPYQGKGVKYSDERIMRKQGKAAGAK